jgi:hypothetical protein
MSAETSFLPKNRDLRSAPVTADHRDRFAGSVARRPLDPAFATAFLHSKMHIARTHPAGRIEARTEALFDFAKRLGSVPASHIHQPVPGGVGYGSFYAPDYRAAFATGTDIIWSALAPAVAGGNVSNYLYATATNRSSSGVEALISYDGNGQLSFQVYDWARAAADRWQVNTPYAELNRYLAAQTYQGQTYPVLPIWNSTTRTAPGAWRNSVYLFDAAANVWALVYQFDYPTPDAAQRAGWVGSWAPIVETFQTIYAGTNPLGALGTQLRGADADGAWSDWAYLNAEMSTLRTDNVGFQQNVLDPNYDWIVTS